ncbi:MAG: hypothetical protein AB7P02_23500 [Alphaproteobacteria bacterium]
MRILVALAMAMLAVVEAAMAAQALTEHRDPAGFVVVKPADWWVDASALDRIAIGDPAHRAIAFVRGRVARGDLSSWLAGEFLQGESWIASGTVIASEAVGRDAARAAWRLVDRNGAPIRATAVAVRRGEIATVFVAAAHEDAFVPNLPTLASILDSFRFGAPAGAAGPPPLDTVIWVDPVENAFSTHVPRGWATAGGMVRRGLSSTRPTFTVTSPDGAVVLFVGDPATPRFIIPSQMLASLGYREGSIEPSSGSVISRFRHAGDIGQEMVQRRFGRVELSDRRDRPDLVETRRRHQPVMQGSVVGMTGADLDFRLQDGRVGTMSLTNSGWNMPNLAGQWSVDDVWGFVAPPNRTAEAGAALAHVLGTFRVNPDWFRRELGDQVRFQEQYMAYFHHAAQQQQQTVNQRWAVQDRQGREWRDALTNTVRLVDPQTNETFEVQSGARYFYRNPNPQRPGIAGVDIDANPDPIEMRRLLQMGVDIPYR